MKDELHIFCKLEGMDEIYLRAQVAADKRLLRLEKKREKKKEHAGRECKSLEYFIGPDEG